VLPHGFVRAHRQALVRLDGVRSVTSNDAGDLVAVLACGTKVPIARRRRAEFTAALKRRVV
jgi:DNA-binding LytR/AlgR family response regulator